MKHIQAPPPPQQEGSLNSVLVFAYSTVFPYVTQELIPTGYPYFHNAKTHNTEFRVTSTSILFLDVLWIPKL
jgi:hypothetical protein